MSQPRSSSDGFQLPAVGPRRVLLVGAGTFLGPPILAALASAGHRVLAQVAPGEPWGRWPDLLIEQWPHPVPEVGGIPPVGPPSASVLVHAWTVQEEDGHPEDLFELSVSRLRRVLELGERAGATRLVLVSGIEAVGPRTHEEGFGYENAESRPVLHVGGALAAAETRARSWLSEQPGRSLVVLRAGHLFGNRHPGFLDRVLAILAETDQDLLRSEWANRRFQPLHVEDLGQAVALSITRGQGIYHVTDGSHPTVGSVIRDLDGVARLKGLTLPRVRAPHRRQPSSERVHYAFPPDRARRELGFVPRWTLSAGMMQLAKDLRLKERGFGNDGFDGLESGEPRSPRSRRVSQTGRFWDEQGAVADLLYNLPHEWAYDQRLGGVLQAPVYRFLIRALRQFKAASLLEFGCGIADFSRHAARTLDLSIVGVDPSRDLIERAGALAQKEGISDRAEFEVGDLLQWKAKAPVDAFCVFGALRHFPDLEQNLPTLLRQNLRPGGHLLAVEPYCEDGYHPSLLRVMRSVQASALGRFFDVAGYEAAAGRGRETTPFQRHRGMDLDRFLKSRLKPVRVRYMHFLSPFVANAFVVYQRSEWVRRLARWAMPGVVRLDNYGCRFAPLRRWAALGLYALRYEGSE